MTTGTPPSYAAVSARIPARDFYMLEQQQNPEDAYAAAVTYCAGAADRAGKTLDWTHASAGEALRMRFWYELYAAVEGESVAQDKMQKADTLLAQLLGDAAVAEAGARNAANAAADMPALGVVKQAPRVPGLGGFRSR